MISRKCFTKEWVEEQRKQYPKADPLLDERFIYAFELVGRLATIGEPFVFRGGTLLALHVPVLKRLSIDVDGIGGFTTEQLQKIIDGSIFKSFEEDKREGGCIEGRIALRTG